FFTSGRRHTRCYRDWSSDVCSSDLNGGVEKPFVGEDRRLIPSPKVATYDLKPEMSAVEVTHEVLSSMADYDLIILNFANPDMVRSEERRVGKERTTRMVIYT